MPTAAEQATASMTAMYDTPVYSYVVLTILIVSPSPRYAHVVQDLKSIKESFILEGYAVKMITQTGMDITVTFVDKITRNELKEITEVILPKHILSLKEFK